MTIFKIPNLNKQFFFGKLENGIGWYFTAKSSIVVQHGRDSNLREDAEKVVRMANLYFRSNFHCKTFNKYSYTCLTGDEVMYVLRW